MPDPRARPGFGQLDFDVDAPDDGAPTSGFGEIDLPLVNAEPPPEAPASSHRARSVVENLPGSNDATRIVTGDPLAALSALSFGEEDEDGLGPAPSDSGIATRDARVAEMRDRYARGDARGALDLAERISSRPPPPLEPTFEREPEPLGREEDPHEFYENVLQEKSETRQRRDVLAQLGPDVRSAFPAAPPHAVLLTLTARQAIPRVLVGSGELALLPLDHRAGFLLAHMDGIHTMEEILDICAMPPEEALALIRELEALGAVRIE